jgi:hypothetical protein
MTSPDAAARVAAESWFLRRGLPSVLTPRARWRRLWARSAPALAGYATFAAAAAAITLAAGGGGVNIDGNPTPTEWFILAVLGLSIPVAIVVSWLVWRIEAPRGRRIAAAVAVAVAAGAALLPGSVADKVVGLILVGVLIAAILVLNGLGIGSVLGWAMRLTALHLASVGALFARALPVVLLTVLVFFNGYVWTMATKLSRDRMWLIVDFMVLIAIAFLVTGIVDRVQPMLASTSARDTDNERLADTPFEAMPDPITGDPLRRGERINVVFVAAASQVTQIATVAVVTSAIFFGLGLVALSPDLLADWTRNGTDRGTWLGMTLPVPQALIHVSMFLGALTFMYVSARAVGDGEYRSEFLDPLVDDLRLTLVARHRYRAHIAAGAR